MKRDATLQELQDTLKSLESKLEELIAVTIDKEEVYKPKPRRTGGARSYSVAACVTEEEKNELDRFCEEYSEERGWIIRRGALLRLVWLHFLDNHAEIDLEQYRD